MAFPLEHTITPPSSGDHKVDSSTMIEHIGDYDHGQLPLNSSLTQRTTKLMAFFSFWVALGGWLVNFDLGYTGIVLQMQPFNRAFGSCAMVPVAGAAHGVTVEKCSLSATQQSVISIYVLFMALGGGLTSIAGSYFGRRTVIQLSAIPIIIGAAGMLGTEGHYPGYIVCKCIGGLGIGLLSTTAPIYGAECTPSKRRGLLVSVYGIGLALGAVVVASVCLGSSRFLNNWAWRIPILCQIPVAIIYAAGLMIFPESPRWLLIKGKEEKARKSFGRFYNKDPHSEEVNTQIYDIQATLELEKSMSASWLEIFHKKYRRRTFTSTGCIVGSALSGVNFIVPYATIFLADVGIKNPYDITVYLDLCILAGCIVGPIPCQYLGRRRTLLTGYVSMAVCMLIFSATTTALGATNTSAQHVLVAFLCIWNFLFGSLNASTVWLASVEQHSVRHRTYGQAFTITVSYCFNFASNFWTPYMINKKYGNMGLST